MCLKHVLESCKETYCEFDEEIIDDKTYIYISNQLKNLNEMKDKLEEVFKFLIDELITIYENVCVENADLIKKIEQNNRAKYENIANFGSILKMLITDMNAIAVYITPLSKGKYKRVSMRYNSQTQELTPIV